MISGFPKTDFLFHKGLIIFNSKLSFFLSFPDFNEYDHLKQPSSILRFRHFQVSTEYHGVPDEILQRAAGFKAICIFVNKKIDENQGEILKANGNELILCCSAGFDNVRNFYFPFCKMYFGFAE